MVSSQQKENGWLTNRYDQQRLVSGVCHLLILVILTETTSTSI